MVLGKLACPGVSPVGVAVCQKRLLSRSIQLPVNLLHECNHLGGQLSASLGRGDKTTIK